MADTSWEHAAEARAALNAIVTDPDHGVGALSSPRTMSNLLKDLLPDAPREKNLLVAAAEAGLADTLREHVDQGMDSGTAIRLTASSFSERSPLSADACSWVTNEIAKAMGISQSTVAGGAAWADPGAGGAHAWAGQQDFSPPIQNYPSGDSAPGSGSGPGGWAATPAAASDGSPPGGGVGWPGGGSAPGGDVASGGGAGWPGTGSAPLGDVASGGGAGWLGSSSAPGGGVQSGGAGGPRAGDASGAGASGAGASGAGASSAGKAAGGAWAVDAGKAGTGWPGGWSGDAGPSASNPGTGSATGSSAPGTAGNSNPGPSDPAAAGQAVSNPGASNQGWSGQGWSGQGWSGQAGSVGYAQAPPGGYPGQPGYSPVPGPPSGPSGQAYPVAAQAGYQPVPGRSGSSNTLAVVAFVLGLAQIVGWFIFLFPGLLAAILAIVLGFVSVKQMNRSGERGRGLAITGIILGFAGIVIVAILVAIGLSVMNKGSS